VFTIIVTGGLGSGKSEAAKILQSFGAEVIDLDDVAKEVREKPEVYKALSHTFGPDILDIRDEISPSKLAEIAFLTSEKAEQLNAIMHPAISKEILAGLILKSNDKTYINKVVVLELTLIDKASDVVGYSDFIIGITSRTTTRTLRALRKGLTREDAMRRISLQLSDEELSSYCDTLIANDGSLEDLREELTTLAATLGCFDFKNGQFCSTC
jgi:dephospho-CoA kinase